MTAVLKTNPAPGFQSNPNYPIFIQRSGDLHEVFFDGTLLASSSQVSVLTEGELEPVFYFPKSAVADLFLAKTEHVTFCPYKGYASYWSIVIDDKTVQNAVWSYLDPYDEVLKIKDHVAFWVSKSDDLRCVTSPVSGS